MRCRWECWGQLPQDHFTRRQAHTSGPISPSHFLHLVPGMWDWWFQLYTLTLTKRKRRGQWDSRRESGREPAYSQQCDSHLQAQGNFLDFIFSTPISPLPSVLKSLKNLTLHLCRIPFRQYLNGNLVLIIKGTVMLFESEAQALLWLLPTLTG